MKTIVCKPLETRFNRRPMPRYTLKIKRVPIDLQGRCIIFDHVYKFFTPPLYNFFTALRVRVRFLTDF